MFRFFRKNSTRCQRRFLFIFILCLLAYFYAHHQNSIHDKIHDLNQSRVINEIYPNRRPKNRGRSRNLASHDYKDNYDLSRFSKEDLEDDSKPYEAPDFGAAADEEQPEVSLLQSSDVKEVFDAVKHRNAQVDSPKEVINDDKVGDSETDNHANDGVVESHQAVADVPHHNELFPKPKLGIAGTWRDETKKFTPQQIEIRNEFLYAWKAYKKSAWGRDTLKPLSKSHETWFEMGLTILDSLDNLIIFQLDEEFQEAKEWVANGLSFDQDIDYVNLFECTIRVLGGLLSAHTLSAEPIFLDRAKDIGERLLSAWSQSKTEIPLSDINPYTRKSRAPRWGSDSSTSEVTTVQLEFRELAILTNEGRFSQPSRKTSEKVHKLVNAQSDHHFVQMMINPHSGKFARQGTITFGARTDSYYEYLLKQWIQSNGDPRDEWLLKDYLVAMDDLKEKLVTLTNGPERLTFIAELQNNRMHPKMDHLVCFLPGTLALGWHFSKSTSLGGSRIPDWHLELAEELARTCSFMYSSFATGLPPEIVYFDVNNPSKEIYVKPLDAFSLLRPESVESWFYLYRITGKEVYRDYGWSYFQALKNYAKVDRDGGYASVDNVDSKSTRKRDKMESFFMAETLKYMFLLFSDDDQLLPLDKFVFNTEAHPLLIRTANHEVMFQS